MERDICRERIAVDEVSDTAEVVSADSDRKDQAGFTLIEVCCSLVIILIALLGVAFSFTYAINYNAGNKSRSHALAVLQQRVEQLRAAKFTPTVTDAALTGGVKTTETITTDSGERFTVAVKVDNDPIADGIQDDAAVPAPTLKEITVTTSLASPSPGWQTAVPTLVVLRRVRAN